MIKSRSKLSAPAGVAATRGYISSNCKGQKITNIGKFRIRESRQS